MNYLSWVIDNDLHKIYPLYSNPAEGVRLAAVKPAREYAPQSKPCFRNRCEDGVMHLTDSPAAVYECEMCGATRKPIYRWRSSDRNSGWMRFSTHKAVSYRAKYVRSWYATLGVFDKSCIYQKSIFNWDFLNAYTLGIDIDIRSGLITEYKNRVALDKTLSYLKDVFSCCENSYNLQTSGNGLYFMIHHSLCTKDIMETAGKFRMLLRECADKVDKLTGGRIKIDDQLVNASQVFKLAGSLHQTYDLVAIPVDANIKFVGADLSQTDPGKFDMHNFVDDDGKVEWYDNKKSSEAKDLYGMLDELNIDVESFGAVTFYERENKEGKVERTYNTKYQRENVVSDSYVYSVNNASYMLRNSDGEAVELDEHDISYIKRIEEKRLLVR